MTSKSGNPATVETAPTEGQAGAQAARVRGFDEIGKKVAWEEMIKKFKSHGQKINLIHFNFYPNEDDLFEKKGTVLIELKHDGIAYVSGDTYPVKEIIKKHGGKFLRSERGAGWKVEKLKPSLIDEIVKKGYKVRLENRWLDEEAIE